MNSPIDLGVLGVSLTEVNPGLTFWTLVAFAVLFFVLRWKAWKPILGMVQEREKLIQGSLDAAQHERKEAERILEEQKKMVATARQEAAEIIENSRAEAEKIKDDLLAKSRKEAEETLFAARKQIEEEKLKAIAEVRGYAVDIALQAAQKLVEVSLDEPRQRQLVSDFISSVGQERPAA